MAENFETRRQELRGTAAAWTSNNTVLLDGEWGIESDTGKAKVGDGVTAWNSLPYFGGGTLEGVIAADPIATSVPEFEGGVNIGDDSGTPFFVFFKDSDGSYIASLSAGDVQFNFQTGITFLTPELLLGADAVMSWSDIDLNVSTNNLSLSDGDVKPSGFRARVSVGGTRDFGSGNITLGVNDVLAKNRDGIYFKAVDNNQSGGSTTEVATYVATNTGTVTLDCDTFDSSYRILTGNTDFQFSNTPASGETFVKTLEVITTAGESLTFTTADNVIGTFVNDNTTVNIITVNLANYPTEGLRVTVMINS